MSKVGKWYGLKLGKMASQNPCVYADSKNLLILLTKYTHCCEAEPAEPFSVGSGSKLLKYFQF